MRHHVIDVILTGQPGVACQALVGIVANILQHGRLAHVAFSLVQIGLLFVGGGQMSFVHIDQYQQMHAAEEYGNSSARYAPFLIPHIRQLKPKSVIDYGCGQSALPDLIKAAGVPYVHRYEPAIAAFAARPDRTFDLLLCTDVLEHVPEDELDSVVEDMRSLARNAMLIVDTKPARQFLPNGDNAHATIRPIAWWQQRLARHYELLEPFLAKPLNRARFKTWRTPLLAKPLLWVQASYLDAGRRLRKHQLKKRLHASQNSSSKGRIEEIAARGFYKHDKSRR